MGVRGYFWVWHSNWSLFIWSWMSKETSSVHHKDDLQWNWCTCKIFNCKDPCPWYAYYANSKWVAGGMGGGGGGRGVGQGGKESCELRVCSPKEAHDTKVLSMVVSTSSLGGRFQSLMVLGKNEVFLTCNAFLPWWAWTAHRDCSAGERGGGRACHHRHEKFFPQDWYLLTYSLRQ